MASNNNQNEIDQLNNDGKIDFTDTNEERSSTLKEVETGKKSVSTIKRKFSAEEIGEHARKNDVIAKLLGFQNHLSISIIDTLKDKINAENEYNEDELDDVINKKVEDLIKTINGKSIVQFSSDGSIDDKLTHKRAEELGAKIPGWAGSVMNDMPYIYSDREVLANDFRINNQLDKELIDYLNKNFTKEQRDYILSFEDKYSIEQRKEIRKDSIETQDKHYRIIMGIHNKFKENPNYELSEEDTRVLDRDSLYVLKDQLINQTLSSKNRIEYAYTLNSIKNLYKYVQKLRETAGPEEYDGLTKNLEDILVTNLGDALIGKDGKFDVEMLERLIRIKTESIGILREDVPDDITEELKKG